MKNLILLFGILIMASTCVLAQWGNYGMMSGYGYGMMGGAGWFVMGLLGLIYLAIAAFIVSVIFWLTYKWIVKSKGASDGKKIE